MSSESASRSSEDNTPQNRLKDRTGKDWPEATQAEGVLNRVLFAAPGQILKFRPGTEELNCHRFTKITFTKVMNALENLCGNNKVVKKLPDGSYEKLTEDCGSNLQAECLNEQTLIHPLVEIAKYYINLEEDSMDIIEEDNLKKFIKKRVHQIIDDEHTDPKPDSTTKKFLHNTSADITELIAKHTIGRFPINSVNDRVPLSHEIALQIQTLLEMKGTGVGKFRASIRGFFDMGNKQYAQIANKIAFNILLNICNHPSNKDPYTQWCRKQKEKSIGAHAK